MRELAFPGRRAFATRDEGGNTYIHDELRNRWVRLTPEEWVRRHLAWFLIEQQGFPRGLTGVERAFERDGVTFRADVVVVGRDGPVVLLAECKGPDVAIDDVAIDDASFDQVARYNRTLGARWLVVTNGLVHHCLVLGAERRMYVPAGELPRHQAPLIDRRQAASTAAPSCRHPSTPTKKPSPSQWANHCSRSAGSASTTTATARSG